MQVKMNNSEQVYTVHNGRLPKPQNSYFLSEFNKWETKEGTNEATDAEVKKMRSKYNKDTSNMTDKEKVDYLGNLVKSGAITKELAGVIYSNINIVKIDPNFRGELTKGEIVNPSQRNQMSPGNTSGNWLEQYRTLFDYMLDEQNLAVDKTPSTIQSYEEYSSILARMSKYKAVGEV